MIYLKEANVADAEKEYQFLKSIPANENGFDNKYHDFSYEEFIKAGLPQIINISKGINLPNDYLPETFYFLWDDNDIVGLFKLRHYLTASLRNGAYIHHSDEESYYTRIKIR